MNRNHRRLAISSGAVAVSAALAASSWAAALPSVDATFSGATGDRSVGELVLAVTGAEFLGATEEIDLDTYDLTIDQVLMLLQRAEQVARTEGDGFSEEAANAAVQLAELLDTYLGQQAAGQTDGVTLKDVALAAIRLAKLLNPSGSSLLGTMEVSDDLSATPLTSMLRDLVDQYGNSTTGYQNGKLPDNVLCALPFAPGHRLRCDAAASVVMLNSAFQARFGRAIPVTDSYRTLEAQVRLSITKPTLAARPGTSQHGWGLALDLGSPISTGLSAEYYWLRENGPQYGWDNPEWARLTGSKPEPWHFEFFAGGAGGTSSGLSAAELAQYQAALNGTATSSQTGSEQTDNSTYVVDPSQPLVPDPTAVYGPSLPEDPNETAVVPVVPVDPSATPSLPGEVPTTSVTGDPWDNPTMPTPIVSETTVPALPETPTTPTVDPTTPTTTPTTETPAPVVPVAPVLPQCTSLVKDRNAGLKQKCLDSQGNTMTFRAWAAAVKKLPLCSSKNLPTTGLCVLTLEWSTDQWTVVTKSIAPAATATPTETTPAATADPTPTTEPAATATADPEPAPAAVAEPTAEPAPVVEVAEVATAPAGGWDAEPTE